MKYGRKHARIECQLTHVLVRVAAVLALVWVGLPVQAAPEQVPTIPEKQEPPVWWYNPNKPANETTATFEQPEWWYAPQEDQAPPSAQGFTTLDVNVDLAASQSLSAGVIPLNVEVVADGQTPDIVIQVISDDVPERAVYAGYERNPDGAVQNLGRFQQARFVGGVGTSNTASVQFKYEAQVPGWVVFEVQVWIGGYRWYGPVNHAIYINTVTHTFTSLNATVSLASSQSLNAGMIPLDIEVVADGQTPEIVVQVASNDVPDRAVYVGYEKSPDGTIQSLGGFQQARFVGGVGPDNTASVQFQYEAQVPGWVVLEVQVWAAGNLIYGPQDHAIYIGPVTPNFTSINTTVSLAGSQGLNAGVIPLNIEVVADGPTPEIVVQVVSEHVPERAVYVGYEKTPGGAVQNLGKLQQARFVGGVGSGNTAKVQFKYESLVTGWVVFEVQVWIGGYRWYGPQEHAIYLRHGGTASLAYPPRIRSFGIASQQDNQASFYVNSSGNPAPQYDLDCGALDARNTIRGLTCSYDVPGYYTATLTASNWVEGVEYSDVASARVITPAPVRDQVMFLPLVVRNY